LRGGSLPEGARTEGTARGRREDLGPLEELALLEAHETHQQRPWALLLLLLPLATIIYPPLYDHTHPKAAGLPFFVWYQMAAVVFGGLVTGVVYLLRGTERNIE
jgi:hypothetical protein